MRTAFALIDCDNFYVECERVFDPRLAGRPVVVLSNNDGCVVSRSGEAKSAGVGMGVPLFSVRPLVEKRGVRVLSSNYALYGDMSARVMATLREFTPDVEIYSIDEAFLRLDARAPGQLRELGRDVQRKVRKWTGIPTSVGIAPTKTLAKIAARLAKRDAAADGLVSLCGAGDVREALASVPVEAVWGVGRNLTRLLRGAGIETALDLSLADDRWVKRNMRVTGLRIVHELRGTPCLSLETCPPPKRSITVSRSFGRTVESLEDLSEAVAFFTSRAAEKLRRGGLSAAVMVVYVATNRFGEGEQYSGSAVVNLPVPTDLTPELIGYARRAVEEAYRPGPRYKKAGVTLLELAHASPAQAGLFDRVNRERVRRVMEAVDRVNKLMGAGTLRFAAAGLKQDRPWQTRCESRSPRYTTKWAELPVAS